jgi:hypothetical protein
MRKKVVAQLIPRFMLFLIVGCTSTSPIVESPSSVPTHTLLPTLTVTSTITPTLTAVPTLVEATPVNTMTTEERKNFLTQFLSDSGDCRLPCWWNITPGQTWEDAEKVIHKLGGGLVVAFPGHDSKTTVYGTYIIDEIPTNDIRIEEKDGLVYAWHINSTNSQDPEIVRRIWKNYSAQKIVKAYGMPGRILLRAHPATHPRQYGIYSLWLFYDELGFSILYEARVPRYFFGAPFFRICSETDPLLSIDLNTQSPDNALLLDRFDGILEEVRMATDIGKAIVIHTLQEATGLDDIEIYNTFMQKEGACFAIPSDIWRAKP